MGRKAKFSEREIIRAALRLAADAGPHGVTMSALAGEVGAPTGSIYHRFASREHVLAELWLDIVEEFQRGFVAALSRAERVESAVQVAQETVAWTRAHLREARLLLLHRRQDFVPGEWPPHLVERAAALEPALAAALRAFSRRVLGSADADCMARVRFALIDAPLGGIKPYLQSGQPPPRVFDALVAGTVRAVLKI